ncbi:hypothetical protein [Brachybacterium paraconglomeratum]|uniref:hypothetical protein n=1 Tax=Brachybacterium paraconglomeratum TaxID=173362 RepID=UPI002493A8B0|nr:hypothetical protein [Brachybacterium paraconglomeratum]
MRAPVKLAAYGAGLVVAFGAAFGLAGVAVPDSVVAAWAQSSESGSHGEDHGSSGEEQATDHAMNGVSASAGGYVLSPVTAPSATDDAGALSFRILDEDGRPVTEYTTAHEKDLHLIVVRTDGAEFRHVHPVLDEATSTWSVPSWSWDAAGTYRVYADFTPTGDNAEGVTLTRTVEVSGDYAPVEAEASRTDEVDGYTVTLDGNLTSGTTSDLTVTVERDGQPVTKLEPYLGAFGHLVALREGDLAYLHVHPDGEEPREGDVGGPDVGFAAEVPTAGRYLLYLDFQVDGEVHTAEFVVEAGH